MRSILFSLLIVISIHCHAQDNRWRPTAIVNSATHEEMRCFCFDKKGLMWIGTNNGLKSYDGYSMHTLRNSAYSNAILPSNEVISICVDAQDRIWAGTRNGLTCFDQRTGSSKVYHLKASNQKIIYTLYASQDSNVWIGTDLGLTKFDAKSNEFHTLSSKNAHFIDENGKKMTLEAYSVKAIISDTKDGFFIGTWNSGLFHFNPKTMTFRRFPRLNEQNSAHSLYLDSRGKLWIGTWGYGISCIENPNNPKSSGIKKFNENRTDFNRINTIVENKTTNEMLAASLEGITIIKNDAQNATTANFRSILELEEGVNFTSEDLLNETSRSLTFSNGIIIDNSGQIWIETLYDGIKRVDTGRSIFKVWTLPEKKLQKHPINSIAGICSNDGTNFWLGLKPYGLALFNRATGQVFYDTSIPGFEASPKGMMNVSFTSFVWRNADELWMANNSYGIAVRKRDGSVTFLRSESCKWLADEYVNALYKSRNGTMWIGQRRALSIAFDAQSGQALEMKEGEDDFSVCDVRAISEDKRGNIWVATSGEGIIRISGNPQKPASLRYHHYCEQRGNLPVSDANAVMEDSNGRLWAISNSGGLLLFDATDDAFKPMNREYHIDGGRVFAIQEDANGALWLSTDKALVRLRFDKKGNSEVTSFGLQDGLGDFTFQPNAATTYGNMMFFGSKKGFVEFVPKQIPLVDDADCRLIITDFFIDDQPFSVLDSAFRMRISKETPSYTERIVIPASVKKFEVLFSLLSYGNIEQSKYAYMLEGDAEEWHYQDASTRRATFANLPSGTYHLRLKAADSYGHWCEMPYRLTIRVLPPWYKTWWAWLIYALLFASACYAVSMWYKNYLKTKNRLQMAVVFTNIAHELLTPLTVISSSVDILRRKAPENEGEYGMMQNNVNRLTRLVRNILEVRKSQAGQLKLKTASGNLKKFVGAVCQNLRPLAEAKQINMSVKIAETVPDECWFDSDKVDKIIYNLVSNAIKYTNDGGNVAIELCGDNEKARLTVADNGIGISKDKMHHLFKRFMDGDYRRMKTMGTGIGLSLAHDLTKLHHGNITCESKEGQGTTFTVELPISRDSFSNEEREDPNIVHGSLREESEERREERENIVSQSINSEDQKLTNSKSYTLLLVEDNEELLGIMQRLLSQKYNVLTAKNGQQALNIIRKEGLDIVISDVMMPVMDGIQLTQAIKSDKDLAQLPIILLTAKTSDEDKDTGYESGADEYLTKPFRMESLELRIDNIIKNRERIKQKFSHQTNYVIEDQHYSSPDEIFIQKAVDCVRQHLDDSDYDRESFAQDMCVSSSTLYNKLRAITGQNITGFINSIRLKEACAIMQRNNDISISELAMTVGFNTPKYFSKCFKKEFGMLPTEFLNNRKDESEE